MRRACIAGVLFLVSIACRDSPPSDPPRAAAPPSLLLITVDTLRADRVGAYGDVSARTPAIDALAARGALFTNAFSVAPITLTSHASLLTGRYPAGHGARHNGMRVDLAVPTIAGSLSRAGLVTGAFVAAFPLDRRFGLIKGFQTYGDTMPRGPDGRPANERAGRVVVDEAVGWLEQHRSERFFLWVHLFEPHAPYGDARGGRPAQARYADEIREADRQVARLTDALGGARDSTIVAFTSDHGEAFGEHGEIAHSVFVYDTTLRVPLILAGPGIAHRTVDVPVSLVDLAPTVMRLLGAGAFDADGVDLGPALAGTALAGRTLYAESFAPLLDFGWSPLRAVRTGGWKYIAAPRPELYRVATDAAESINALGGERQRATAMQAETDRYSGTALPAGRTTDRETAARLQALGYVSGGRSGATRPDPKDRRAVAARIAQVTSGELHGPALERMLLRILEDDPRNPLANLRLGYVLLESNRCARALPRFRAAIEAGYPSADAHLGLAGCQAAGRDFTGATATLRAADATEPGNPVVLANLGLMLSDGGTPEAAINPLQRALTTDPELHQARFGLAIAFARTGRRTEAANEARELLRRLPATSPQRAEVERLLRAIQ
ncbi:MAG: sulfatase-like hydrolase/transferase [Acidobacteria bacterium]|nr:sulfatase-like hydrolase/transferase [Acidobacteriota bacterium]